MLPSTMMDEPTWDRGDGQPDPQHLDDTIADILDACRPHRPVEIILFGSGARGELTPTSDADLLVVLADRDQEFAKPVTIAFSVMDGHEPRVDIIVAFQHQVRDAVRSLTSILRTAREEGVPVYRDDRHQPYALRPRPPAVHRAEDANTAREEAERLRCRAAQKLQLAETYARSLHPQDALLDTTTTEVAGSARKAIELALQARIVDTGRRPRAWKDPAGLASEARAVGATLPDIDPKAIERAGNHYSGLAYPGYARPSVEEAAEALELARQIVHHGGD